MLICFNQILADDLTDGDFAVRVLLPDSEAAQVFNADRDSAYLVRPDGHVAARWKTASKADVQNAMLVATQTQKKCSS